MAWHGEIIWLTPFLVPSKAFQSPRFSLLPEGHPSIGPAMSKGDVEELGSALQFPRASPVLSSSAPDPVS